MWQFLFQVSSLDSRILDVVTFVPTPCGDNLRIMLLPTYIKIKKKNINAKRSNSVTVTTTAVEFNFNNHPNIGNPFRGLIIVNLNQEIPSGTTTTLPIIFTTNNEDDQNLVGLGGTAITVADIKGTGIYLVWFESQTNTLQLIS